MVVSDNEVGVISRSMAGRRLIKPPDAPCHRFDWAMDRETRLGTAGLDPYQPHELSCRGVVS